MNTASTTSPGSPRCALPHTDFSAEQGAVAPDSHPAPSGPQIHVWSVLMPSTMISCPRCPTRWRHSERMGHCGGCHATFLGVSAFDSHRAYDQDAHRICRDPASAATPSGAPMFDSVESIRCLGGSLWRRHLSEDRAAAYRQWLEHDDDLDAAS